MTQRNDAQHAGIIAKTSATDGANDDLEMVYLLTQPGVTQANIKDMWRQVFDASASGSANKHYNDAAFIWLGAAGATGATLSERWYSFWVSLSAT